MIDSPRSARVREVARLAKRAAREESGLFLLEGPQAVAEALAWRPDHLVDLFVTDAALERHPQLSTSAAERGVSIELVSERALAAMADTVTPQGVVAVARQFDISADAVLRPGVRLVAILHEVRDPGNAGTIIRAADAAGADGVILTGSSVDVYHPKVVRSTTGSLFHVPVATISSLDDAIALAHAVGARVLAADIKGDDLLEVRREGALADATAWLFGNEARGLADDQLALADRAVRLPIYGRAESLNLATAASVCLYESAFAQRS